MIASRVVGQLRTRVYNRVIQESIGGMAGNVFVSTELAEYLIKWLEERCSTLEKWGIESLRFTNMLTWSSTGTECGEICSALNDTLDMAMRKAITEYENEI